MTVDPTQGTSLNDKEYDKFINCGTRKSAVRVTDTTVATNVLAVTSETVTFAAGAIGTTGVTYVDKAPVYNSTYTHVGEVGDTTFAWVTGTVLPQASEVKYNLNQTDTVQLAALTNGQWAMDYDTGRIRYCKATTGTSDTCNYGTRQLNVDITGVEDLEIGAVEIKDSDSDTRVEVHAPNSVAYGTGMTAMPARYMATIPTITDTFSTPLLVASKGQLLTNIYDGTSVLTLGTGTTKTVPAELNDGTTKIVFGTGTTKNVPCGLTDGTSTITFGTGTTKTVPSELNDGTTKIVFGTGTVKNVPCGLTDGTSTITFGTSTVKTVPCSINDGTTTASVGTGGTKGLYVYLTDGGTTATVDSSSTGLLTTQRQNVTGVTSAALDLTDADVADRTFTTTFTKAWEISRIQILFSTAVSRDITIYNYDGTNLFTEHSDTGDTSTTYVYPAQYSWFGTATDEVRLVFSQALAACTATIRIIYKDA